ncbi:MAG: flavin reductase family protein [Candidatus Heimdallarchaeota archaeon]|nr:MAG: flavin reductase family protein [Candidatus Heimdallarchaeota archaeon]
MSKINIKPNVSPFPMPIAIIGALVEDRPNFMTVAWFNRLNGTPPIWGIAMGKRAYTLEGIRSENAFSINIPAKNMVEKVDYCGIVSGRKVDKAKLFNIFYGELETVPMIQECPLCLESRVYQIIELPRTTLVLGEVVNAYTEEEYMSEGELDSQKINPFTFSQPDNKYWGLGDMVGDAFAIGKTLKK